MKNRIIYFIVILGLIFTSCKTQRSVIKAPLKEQGSAFLFKKLQDNELKYKTFKASFSAEYEKNKKKTSIKGTILINKDSIIWSSIGPGLGIELARVSITPDTVKILNKIGETTYLIQNFDYINDLINNGLDYDMLQSLIIGNDFSVYDNSSFKASIDKHEYSLSTLNRRRLRKLSKDADSLTDVIINNQLVPQSVEFNINDGTNKIHILLNYSKIRLDTQQSYPFSIRPEYKRVDRF